MGRIARWLIVALTVVAMVAVALIWLGGGPEDAAAPGAATKPTTIVVKPAVAASCARGGAWTQAAAANGASLHDLAWSLTSRDVVGWEIYTPLIGHELASACPPDSPGFAMALAGWQGAHGLPASGLMDPTSFEAIWVTMLRRRPFVRAMSSGCPPPAAASDLELARPDETFAGQSTVMAGREALQAYRTMLAAARADAPAIRDDPRALKIISGFRAPQADGGYCPLGQTCSNLTRAHCSAHRTGRAFDLYLGAAPGRDPTSTEDDNRLYQSQTLAYRWLVDHAAQYGFLPYPYEPWHWEWAG